jgi:hypothetical protein
MKRNILRALALAVLLGAFAAAPVLADATIIIVNADGANEGFNDPTPAASVPAAIKGDNPGATLGAMRLNVFQFAADTWGAKLDSNVTIFVIAQFNSLGPNVLGSAGTTFIFGNFGGVGNFPGSEFPDTWYHSALSDKRAGTDLAPGFADIVAQFSSDFLFYLGLDDNHGALNDLATVVIHELGHGLGFSNFVTEATGANSGPPFFTDIFSRFTLDDTNGLHWSDMNDAQRQASAIRFRHISFDGPNVTAAVPSVLQFGQPSVRINTPAAIAGELQFGTAAFGPQISAPGITGNVVPGVDVDEDGAGTTFTTTDGCSPLTNAAAVAGNIALLDRGGCGFVVKAKTAQDAGATACIIANNAVGAPPGMAGTDPTVVIPSVSITQADGAAIRANLPATGSLLVDLSIRAGTNSAGFALLYAPNPVQPGSSISHFDTSAFPNLLMEPAINPDLTHSVEPPQDLTLPEMRDVGWFPDADLDGVADDSDDCPDSDLSATVVVGTCDSGVPNTVLPSGCSISDLVSQCAAGAGNHGHFVSCVAHTLNDLKKAGVISGAQKGAIQSCAGGASIP